MSLTFQLPSHSQESRINADTSGIINIGNKPIGKRKRGVGNVNDVINVGNITSIANINPSSELIKSDDGSKRMAIGHLRPAISIAPFDKYNIVATERNVFGSRINTKFVKKVYANGYLIMLIACHDAPDGKLSMHFRDTIAEHVESAESIFHDWEQILGHAINLFDASISNNAELNLMKASVTLSYYDRKSKVMYVANCGSNYAFLLDNRTRKAMIKDDGNIAYTDMFFSDSTSDTNEYCIRSHADSAFSMSKEAKYYDEHNMFGFVKISGRVRLSRATGELIDSMRFVGGNWIGSIHAPETYSFHLTDEQAEHATFFMCTADVVGKKVGVTSLLADMLSNPIRYILKTIDYVLPNHRFEKLFEGRPIESTIAYKLYKRFVESIGGKIGGKHRNYLMKLFFFRARLIQKSGVENPDATAIAKVWHIITNFDTSSSFDTNKVRCIELLVSFHSIISIADESNAACIVDLRC